MHGLRRFLIIIASIGAGCEGQIICTLLRACGEITHTTATARLCTRKLINLVIPCSCPHTYTYT